VGLFSKNNSSYSKIGYWIVQEHLFGDTTYQCSYCKSVFKSHSAVCPKCHSNNRKLSHDPVWVDEIAMMDALFDDDF
jgi:hypothetical protein